MEECATDNFNTDGAAGAVCLFFHFQAGHIPEVIGERGKTRGHCLLRLLGEHGAVSLAVQITQTVIFNRMGQTSTTCC